VPVVLRVWLHADPSLSIPATTCGGMRLSMVRTWSSESGSIRGATTASLGVQLWSRIEDRTWGIVQCTLPGYPGRARLAVTEHQGVPDHRAHAPGAREPAGDAGVHRGIAWLPAIGTPSTTSAGIPPDCSVCIIWTQLPWASTMLSSQLPVGCCSDESGSPADECGVQAE